MPRILGIDPGIRRTGYGVVDAEGGVFRCVEAGVVRPPADAPLAERLLCIESAVDAVIARALPAACALESVFQHKSARSALTLGQAQAAAVLAAARRGLPVSLYNPSEVKQALTGGGRAAKEQVRFMVERILGRDLSGEPDDLSDALAVALCHGGRVGARRAAP